MMEVISQLRFPLPGMFQVDNYDYIVSSFSLVCAHGRVSPGLFTSLWIRKQGTLGSGPELDITFQYSPGQCSPVRSQVPKVLQSPKVEPPTGDQVFEHTHM